MNYLKYIALILGLLIALFIGKGMLTPSVSYESEVIVNKPVEEAWAVMSDESTLPKWIKGFKRTEHVSGVENNVGAVSNVYVEDNGEEMVMKETITAIKQNEYLAMTFTMDFMDMDYEMRLKEKDGKTHILTKSNTRGNGVMAKSILSFMPSSMKAQEDENLHNLKKVIEENEKNYFSTTESEHQPELELEVMEK